FQEINTDRRMMHGGNGQAYSVDLSNQLVVIGICSRVIQTCNFFSAWLKDVDNSRQASGFRVQPRVLLSQMSYTNYSNSIHYSTATNAMFAASASWINSSRSIISV